MNDLLLEYNTYNNILKYLVNKKIIILFIFYILI